MEMPTRGGGRQGGRYIDLGQKETGRTYTERRYVVVFFFGEPVYDMLQT